MVTWGQNQVFTVPGKGTPAPAAPAPSTGFAFGGATPAPATGFGSTPAPASGGLFGSGSSSPAPAPASGGIFGSSPAPAPASGGFFGSTSTPAPASGGGLFGSTPAPAFGGIFGSTPASSSHGLFGSPAPAPSTGLFGAPAPATQQQQAPAGPQIPAYAAMQAHMDASARQEAAKLQTALEKYHKAYTGAPTEEKTKFVTILYNDISAQQKQLQWLMGQRVPPPKPPVVSEREWLEAIVRNPDPELYMPVALVGAVELQTRVAWQQDRANDYAKHLQSLQKARETLQQNCNRTETDLQTLVRIHTNLRSRLLQVMQKVEVARCMNMPLQHDEVTLKRKLLEISRQVDQVNRLLTAAQAKAQGQSQVMQAPVPIVNVPDERELSRVLKGHREAIVDMTKVMEKDKRDVVLLQQHAVSKVPLPPSR